MTGAGMLSALSDWPRFLAVLAEGAVTTVVLTLASSLAAFVLGALIALMRDARFFAPRWFALAFLEVFRNVPVLTQLFILYFGLSRLGIQLPATVAVILGFGLNGAAVCSEIFRGSIAAVDRGQREAAQAIGMTDGRIMLSIIAPQAIRIALPALGNFCIGLLKHTSLASAAAAPELAYRAKLLVSETFRSTEIYCLTALIYFLLSLTLARLFMRMERRFDPLARAA
ncbi:amino acid ABC transporter permease [Bosea sp. (in: a-proteobacteria)]|uniref:amino acid ABC transporter permease n=1 Tax=Bosea sp. (in: a-proteobacteria) TaxID=1871050 RepID=UPI0026340215|nr:amino acid ABC transporter permease [Bosea sp. (in: a-proteobacteria)]MCO5091239.1 amino acid ABC transporter permease [Bosea sp. (in: a-proteobacteria)]